LLAWLRLAKFSQIRGRQPYLIVRKILYVIWDIGAALAADDGSDESTSPQTGINETPAIDYQLLMRQILRV